MAGILAAHSGCPAGLRSLSISEIHSKGMEDFNGRSMMGPFRRNPMSSIYAGKAMMVADI